MTPACCCSSRLTALLPLTLLFAGQLTGSPSPASTRQRSVLVRRWSLTGTDQTSGQLAAATTTNVSTTVHLQVGYSTSCHVQYCTLIMMTCIHIGLLTSLYSPSQSVRYLLVLRVEILNKANETIRQWRNFTLKSGVARIWCRGARRSRRRRRPVRWGMGMGFRSPAD